MRTPQDVLAGLLGCLRTEYATDLETGAVRVVGQPGQVTTADWCGENCGTTLYVRLDAMFPCTAAFPTPDTTSTSCTTTLATRWHVGVHQCITGMDNRGNPPSPAAQTEDTVAIIGHAMRIRKALQCCLRDTDLVTVKASLLGTWTPMGPFGPCAGGHWPFTNRL